MFLSFDNFLCVQHSYLHAQYGILPEQINLNHIICYFFLAAAFLPLLIIKQQPTVGNDKHVFSGLALCFV